MNRRHCLVLIAGHGLAGGPASLRAQMSDIALRRIGVFTPGRREAEEILSIPFFDEMRRLGWVEGQNITYDRVYAADRMENLPRLAADLVARKPELIFTASPPAATAAKGATSSIPIVFVGVVDPVSSGLVASLARPGGNATGITQSIADSLAPKRLQLLREILPGIKRIGLLVSSADAGSRADENALAPVARTFGLTMIVASATDPAAFDASVNSVIQQRAEAIIAASSIAFTRCERLIELTHPARIPVVGLNQPMTHAGALFSYGPSLADEFRRAALVGDKILRGAKPSDIPVETANLLELVVNLQSARTLGIKFPESIVLRADKVFQ
jgi:putative ABC transport system substrate-binding protein